MYCIAIRLNADFCSSFSPFSFKEQFSAYTLLCLSAYENTVLASSSNVYRHKTAGCEW